MESTAARSRWFALLAFALAAMTRAQSGIQATAFNPRNGHTYYLLDADTWSNSEAAAVALGGHLATIRSEAEHDWIIGAFGDNGRLDQPIWIGLYQDTLDHAYFEPGGGWKWVSGEPFSFTYWAPSEPDNQDQRPSDQGIASGSGTRPFPMRGDSRFAQMLPGLQVPKSRWGDASNRFLACGVVELPYSQIKSIPNGTSTGDSFGRSIAIAGTTAVIGAPLEDNMGTDTGAAYVLDILSRHYSFKLQPANPSNYELFGLSVAVSGTIAVIGAPNAEGRKGSTGAAYLYDTSTGKRLRRLFASDGNGGDGFGWAVGISGTTVLVGSSNGQEAVYVFDAITGQELLKLTPSGPPTNAGFGKAIVISGTTAVVGAPFAKGAGSKSGAVYVFDTTTGQELRKFFPRDGMSGDSFGDSLSLSGTILAVGAHYDDDQGTRSGSAYLYNTTGTQLAKFLPADGKAGDEFGYSVSIDGTRLMVGAPWADAQGVDSGAVYQFDVSTGRQVAKLMTGDLAPGDYLGVSCCATSVASLIGATGGDDHGSNSGCLYFVGTDSVSVGGVDIDRAGYDEPAAAVLTGSGFAMGGTTTVLFGGVPATHVNVVSDTSIRCTTPKVDSGDADVPITVTNTNGVGSLLGAFSFIPALRITGNPAPGETITLDYLCDPGDTLHLIYGLPPGVKIPTPPYDGVLGIWPYFRMGLLLNWPFDTFSQNLTLPNAPSLSGTHVLFQGLVGPRFAGYPKDGAWTNVGTLDIW